LFFNKINIFACTNKMHISTILLVISVILSGVAVGLPLWSGVKLPPGEGKVSSGLWSLCQQNTPGGGKNPSCQAWSKDNKAPKDLIVSQITAVAGAALALIALALCAMNHKTAGKVSALVAVLCMITVLIVYPVVSLPDLNKIASGGLPGTNSELDVSYYLEVGAAVLAIGALVTCHFMKHKK